MALEHLLNTAERDRCVQLVTELVLPTYQAGQLSTVQRWLAALGDAAIESYPPLAVLAGYIAVFTGHIAEAQRWAAIVDAASFDLVPLDGTASFDSARAMFRAVLCAAGPEQMLSDASFAVEQEPPWSPWRDTALCFCAEAHLLTGDVDASRRSVRGVVDAGRRDVEHRLARRQRGRARPAGHGAGPVGRRGRARGPGAQPPSTSTGCTTTSTSVLAFAVAARLALHRGDLPEANRQLTQAMRARPSCTFVLPWLAVRARLQLAKVHWAIADQAGARHLLREIDDVLVHRPALGTLVDEVEQFRQVLTSSPTVGGGGGSPLTPAELRLLPYLQTHLTIREIAKRLFVSHNTVNSQVSSIYRKLGVSSRDEAVQRATAAGLLGG